MWSNCIAAWLLAGGGTPGSLAFVLAGSSLIYTAGMFLNDVFDAGWDAKYRQERPIPSGRLARRNVALAAMVLLGLGWLSFSGGGLRAFAWAGALCGSIILYNALHKRTAAAPLLMALCRFLLYCSAATAAASKAPSPALWPAVALAAYIAGLSYIARTESKAPGRQPFWVLGLLFLPILVGAARVHAFGLAEAVPIIAFAAWLSWLFVRACARHNRLAHAVPGLLAGIVLVDWMLIPDGFPKFLPIFASLFLLSLLMQKFVPSS